MTSIILRSTVAAIMFVGAVALATPSMAAMVNFKASLSGKSEVPPNTTAGTGSVTASYDTDSKKLTWKGSYSGLTGPASAAHFHGPAPAGKNAGVMVPDQPERPLVRRLGHTQRRPGQGPDGWRHVRQRSHCRQQGGRDPRPVGEIVRHKAPAPLERSPPVPRPAGFFSPQQRRTLGVRQAAV